MMPPAPSLGRGEHSASAAHVAKRTLAGSVSSASTDSGNSGDCSSGSPGGGRRLLSGSDVDAVRLAAVLHHLIVNKRHNVGTNGSFEDGREVDAFAGEWGGICAINGDERSRRHFCEFLDNIILSVGHFLFFSKILFQILF